MKSLEVFPEFRYICHVLFYGDDAVFLIPSIFFRWLACRAQLAGLLPCPCGLWLATQVTRNFAMTGEGGLAAWPWWMDGKTRSFFVHGNTQWPNGIQAYSRDQLAAAMANKPWVL